MWEGAVVGAKRGRVLERWENAREGGDWTLGRTRSQVTSTALQDPGVLGPGGELPSVATRVWRGWRLGRCEKCQYKNKTVKL